MEITLPKNNVYCELLEELSKAIKGSKWENTVYLCGGCVRDLILGREIHDIDIVVAKYCGAITFANWLTKEYGCFAPQSNPVVYKNSNCVKINIKTIEKFKKIDIEIRDTKALKHEFGTLVEDAICRDLTINSLYMDMCTKRVLDPTRKGLNDLKEGILRTPMEDRDTLFDVDPIKMMRIMRFHATLPFDIEKGTWIGIVKNAHKIEKAPIENITNELSKILVSEYRASIALRKMYYNGLLKKVLPEVCALKGCEQGIQHFGDAFDHTMNVVLNVQPYLSHRLGALFHDIAKPQTRCVINGKVHFFSHEYRGITMAEEILTRMKFPNAIIEQVKLAVKNHMRFKQCQDIPNDKALRKFMSEMENSDNMALVLDVINADNMSHKLEYRNPEQVNKIINRIIELKDMEKNLGKSNKLPINGNEIMEYFGLKKGPKIGYYLDIVKDAYFENPNITKEECFKEIEKIMHLDIV